MRKRLFFAGICLLLFIDMTNFTFVVPILPDFLQKQGVSLSLIGFILSFYQISFFFTSLYLGKQLIVYSKNKVMFAGQLVLIISNIAFALLDHNFSAAVVITLSSILRFLQGIALALVCATIYAYVPFLFPHDIDKMYPIIEISLGCGMSLGPVIGGFCYEFLGYFWSFMLMTFVYIGVSFIVFPMIFKLKFKVNHLLEAEAAKEADEKPPTGDEENRDRVNLNSDEGIKNESSTPPIRTSQILKNRNFLLTFFVFVFSYTSYYIIQPGFSDHIHHYDGDEDTVGMIFGLGDLTYALTGFILLRFISKVNVKRKFFFLFGGFMSFISLLVLGPEEYTFLPRSLITVTVGMGILGFAQMFYIATLIPEYIEIFKEIDPTAQGSEEMACGIFNASLAGTEFVGAILGGVMSDEFGFSRGMSIYAIALVVYLTFYAMFRKYKREAGPRLSGSHNFIIKSNSNII